MSISTGHHYELETGKLTYGILVSASIGDLRRENADEVLDDNAVITARR